MQQHPYVIGHRGVKAACPENTLVSFRKALELKVDAIEFDVRITRDRQLVISHDDAVDRCSNGTGRIADLTLAELRRLDFGVKTGPEFAGTRIPTLEETLDLIGPETPILLELKDDDDDCTRAVAAELRARNQIATVLVVSFLPRQLNLMHRLIPGVRLQGFPARYLAPGAGEYDHIDKTCIWLKELTATEIADWHRRGIAVDTCAVDSVADLERALEFDCDSFTTNAAHVIIPELKARRRR